MEIRHDDIQRKKKDLEEEAKSEFERKQSQAKETITDKLARGNYVGVLELSAKYKIQLPKDHLERAAELYSRSSSSLDLGLAKWAYEKLGQQEKARELEAKTKRAYDDERASETLRAMTDGI